MKDGQMFDLLHTDLTQDPVRSMEKIYAHFDISFSRTVQKMMQIWLQENPRSKYGSYFCMQLNWDWTRTWKKSGSIFI